MKTNIWRATIIFAALAAAGVSMVVLSQGTAVSGVLPLLGAALLGSGLTYFLFKLA